MNQDVMLASHRANSITTLQKTRLHRSCRHRILQSPCFVNHDILNHDVFFQNYYNYL